VFRLSCVGIFITYVLKAIMNTLDERYLDGPNVGYCSDSDEDDFMSSHLNGDLPTSARTVGPKTGPKGVLADFRLQQGADKIAAAIAEERMLQQAQRFALSSTSYLESDEDDNELEEIRKRRLQRIKDMNSAKIIEVTEKRQFLNIIEATAGGTRAIVHLYRDDVEGSKTLNDALLDIAAHSSNCLFYKIRPSALGMSARFNDNALPTLQVYENEELIGNFVRLTDTLGEDFDGSDLRRFLAERDITFETSV